MINLETLFHRFGPAAFLLLLIGALAPGCSTQPPQVNQSVKAVRETVAELHVTHAQDARAFASTVNRREVAQRDSQRAINDAFRAMMQAEVDLSKLRVLQEYERRVNDLLGVEFANALRDNLHNLDIKEQGAVTNFISVFKDGETTDPTIAGRRLEAFKQISDLQFQRQDLISRVYLSRAAALSKARFKFIDLVDEKYLVFNQRIRDLTIAVPSSDQPLKEFNDRTDQHLRQLDIAYNALDQVLSDLSTYIDGEAMSQRFSAHLIKGVASALVDNLKNSDLAGTTLSDFLSKSYPVFVNQLKDTEDKLKIDAERDTKEAATRGI